MLSDAMLGCMEPASPPEMNSSGYSDIDIPQRKKAGSVTFSEKVHIYEFPRDAGEDACTNWLAQRLLEDRETCQALESQWSRELSDSIERTKRSGSPYSGSLSWSAAARIESMGERPVQLVRLEQRKVDPCAPIHSIKGQIYVQNLAYHKRVTVRITRDAWHSYTEVDACYAETLVPGHNGVDCFVFDHTISLDGKAIHVEPSEAVITGSPFDVCDIGGCAKGAGDSESGSASVAVTGARSNGQHPRLCIVQLAVQFTSECGEYWDSNHGANYTLVLRG